MPCDVVQKHIPIRFTTCGHKLEISRKKMNCTTVCNTWKRQACNATYIPGLIQAVLIQNGTWKISDLSQSLLDTSKDHNPGKTQRIQQYFRSRSSETGHISRRCLGRNASLSISAFPGEYLDEYVWHLGLQILTNPMNQVNLTHIMAPLMY